MQLYKLLIVDDEPSIRFGLRDYFEWSSYGIEVIGTAEDGSIAHQMIMELHPDIILTDVQMPRMDGITLTQELINKNLNIKTIFISGHNDIDYVKSALRLDALDYILKPIDMEELSRVVEKVIALMETEKKLIKQISRMKTTLAESMPLLKEKFFITLVRDGIENEETLQKRLDFLGVHFKSNALFSIMIISIDHYFSLNHDMSETNKQLTSFCIINICKEIIDKYVYGQVFENKQNEYVCILNLEKIEDEEILFTIAKEIKDELLTLLQLSVTIGMAKTTKNLRALPELYHIAHEAIAQKLFLGKNKIITMDSFETNKRDFFQLNLQKRNKFSLIIKAGNEHALSPFLHELFQDLEDNRNITLKNCQNICLQLMLICSNILLELEIYHNELAEMENNIWEQLFKMETLLDMKSCISDYFHKSIFYIKEKRRSKSDNIVNRIKSIIFENYNQNITIQEIASKVYLTSTYICMIFKEETGETINEYLTKVRMEKAKEMLKDSRNKLYDICYSVGYTDPSYFSKLFKKYTGLTPSNYRDSII